MRLKRPAKYGLYMIILSLLILVFNLLFLLPKYDSASLDSYLEEKIAWKNEEDSVITDAYKIYGGNENELYLWYEFEEWNREKQEVVARGSSPMVVLLNEQREAVGHTTLRDGDEYVNNMKELVPFFVRMRMTTGDVPRSIEHAIEIQQADLPPEEEEELQLDEPSD
ncbi:hypothetical protein [Jeotgalibacillus marinus]|uniref:Uncharacterized protein n=1 Tax=Jeotgalibacillus marinus TaxID=86667 RepID=A0ABV3Q0W1_9BACL